MDIEGIKRPAAARSSGENAARKPQPVFVAKAEPAEATQKDIAPESALPHAGAVGMSADPPVPVPKFDTPRYHAPKRPTRLVRKRAWWRRKKNAVMHGAAESSKYHTGRNGHMPHGAQTHRRPTVRRVVWGSLAAVTILVLGVGGFLSWRAYANLHKVFRGTSTATILSKTVVPDDLKAEGDGRINILLMGIGGPTHKGADLTDTIVVLSVDPVNHTAAMLSVPRDLWVKMPFNYFGKEQKINAAYESGKYHTTGFVDVSNDNTEAIETGFDSIDTVIQTVFNLKIHYHVLVNFQAFKQAIDTVGGITIDVPEALIDPTMAWENWNNPVLAPKGVQQMNGHKALLYARSRETTSDFARNQRQRQILLGLKDKALDLGTLSNPAKIDGLISAFGDNVYADLSTDEAFKLYGIMKKISDEDILSIGLTDEPHKLVTTDRVNDASVVRPLAGFFNYGDIQYYTRSQLLDGYIVKEKASVTVAASTQVTADAAANLLKSYGYNVTATVISTEPVAKTTLVDLSRDVAPYTLHYLQARFGVQPVKQLPDGITLQPGSAKFVILVPNEAATQ